MKLFTIKQGKKISVVRYGNNGKVSVMEEGGFAFVKSIGNFCYEVTDNEDEADVLINSDVEKIVWYIMGYIDKDNDYEFDTEVIVTYK